MLTCLVSRPWSGRGMSELGRMLCTRALGQGTIGDQCRTIGAVHTARIDAQHIFEHCSVARWDGNLGLAETTPTCAGAMPSVVQISTGLAERVAGTSTEQAGPDRSQASTCSEISQTGTCLLGSCILFVQDRSEIPGNCLTIHPLGHIVVQGGLRT